MDRKQKLLLADQLHKENRRDEALVILRDLLDANDNDYFAWWGIANVSDDLPERLEAVQRVMELAPTFQKAYALREELEALIPLDDPTLDDDLDMFDLDDEAVGDDTLTLADVDEDAYHDFQAALDRFAHMTQDPNPADTAAAVEDAFADMDFAPPPVELSPEELDGIESSGFNAAVDAISADDRADETLDDGEPDWSGYSLTYPDRDDHTPYEPYIPSGPEEPDYDVPDFNDVAFNDVLEDGDLGEPDFDDFLPAEADLTPFVDDAPTNQLPDLTNIIGERSVPAEDTGWMQEFAPRTLGSRLDAPATEWEEFFHDSEDERNVFGDATPPYDTPTYDDLLALDPLAEVADDDSGLSELLEDISLDAVPTPDDTLSYYGDGGIDREQLAAAAAARSTQPDPTPTDQSDTETPPDAPSFDPMATDLDWSMSSEPSTPYEGNEPHLTTVEDGENNLQEELMDLEIERIARIDREREEELQSMQASVSMLQELDADLEAIVSMMAADPDEQAIDAALEEDLERAEAELDAALGFGLPDRDEEAIDAALEEDLERAEAELDAALGFGLPDPDEAEPHFWLDDDEKAAILDDWEIDLDAPVARRSTDMSAIAPNLPADHVSHEVHEEDLVVRVSSYETPTFRPTAKLDVEETDIDEARAHVGEVVNDLPRHDLIVVPDPLHPPTPLAEFVQKNKAAIGVAVGLVAVRVAWRLLAGGRR